MNRPTRRPQKTASPASRRDQYAPLMCCAQARRFSYPKNGSSTFIGWVGGTYEDAIDRRRINGYAIWYDGNTLLYRIAHCPFCGRKCG